MHILMRVPERFAGRLASFLVHLIVQALLFISVILQSCVIGIRETYRCTCLPPTKHVHSSHGPVDLAETPWPGLLPRFLVVRHSLVVLVKDEIFVEFEERFDLCHHPSQSVVGLTLIRIPTTNILMSAREPILEFIVSAWRSSVLAVVAYTCLKLVVLLRGFAHTLGWKVIKLFTDSPIRYS